MSQGESTFERRRYDRAVLTLPGRYMLADGQEFDCQIVDASPFGVAIRAPLVGDLGERVVAYVQELGRIEGVIVRRGIDWFAVELHVPSARLRKLAKRMTGLRGGKRKTRPSGAATTASIGIKIKTTRRCFYRTGERSKRV